MRILKTTQTYYPYLRMGGPPLKVRGIANALARSGHEVTVLTACLRHDADVPLNAATRMTQSGAWISQDRGVESIYLPTLSSYRATTVNPRVIKFCLTRLREFDVVHIYGLYDLIGAPVGWFCRRRHIPYVLEPLGMFGPKIRSHRKKRLYRRLIGKALLRGAAAVVATSETEQRELLEGGIVPEKIILRRNGIDLTEFSNLPARDAFRRKLGVDVNQPLILFLGRLSFIKGLDLLVQAFAQVDPNALLVLAGPDDDDGCVKKVWALVDELKLHGRVIQSAPLYGDEKLEALVAADVFVLPSRYESFGNAAAEAMACGTPVLVTEECGIAPLVENRAGVVVPCDNQELAAGLRRMLGDRSLLAELRSGCQTVAQNLSWDEPVKTMESLYRRVGHYESEITDSKTREPREPEPMAEIH
jgi:glycosyltransferase involved in cell wall biosynthesis